MKKALCSCGGSNHRCLGMLLGVQGMKIFAGHRGAVMAVLKLCTLRLEEKQSRQYCYMLLVKNMCKEICSYVHL